MALDVKMAKKENFVPHRFYDFSQKYMQKTALLSPHLTRRLDGYDGVGNAPRLQSNGALGIGTAVAARSNCKPVVHHVGRSDGQMKTIG